MLVIAKWRIWTSRKHSFNPNMDLSTGSVHLKFKTGRSIEEKKFQGRWKLFINDGLPSIRI